MDDRRCDDSCCHTIFPKALSTVVLQIGTHRAPLLPAADNSMHPSRRTFLKQCGLATVSTSLFAPWESFAAASGWVRSNLTLSSIDDAVLKFVSSYGFDVRMTGGSVLARR